MYEALFQPMRIGSVELKNRISMAPMGLSGLVTSEGGFTPRGVEYFVERARNDVGLLITGCAKVEQLVEPFVMPSQPDPMFNQAHFIQTAIEMNERIHAYGSRIFLQMTFGFGRVVHPKTATSQPVSPSPVRNFWDDSITCRELTTEEVDYLIEQFARAALVARESGFDGIEVHAVHEGYLLDQFTMELFNQRTDKYGGSFENRMRAPVDLLKRTKEVAGADFPVMVRFGLKSYMKAFHQGILPGEEAVDIGRDVPEGIEIARVLEDAGYDAFNADGGVYDSWYWAHPPMYMHEGCYLHLTEVLKKVVKVPVIAAGKLGDPAVAERAIVEGRADGVSLGRPLLSDPEWARKVRTGRVEKIRPCIGCHEACLKRIARCKPLSCAVNPAAGREREYALERAQVPVSVHIVGGGIAGMEAARVCALRGHEVSLYEGSDALGGHVIEGSRPDFKIDDRRLLDWYRRELDVLGVGVTLNRTMNAEDIMMLAPQALFVATGSKPVFPPIPGLNLDDPRVATTRQALMGEKPLGDRVAIIGGGLVGCELALWLAQKGHRPSIVERLDELMMLGDTAYPNKMMLLELLVFHKVATFTGASVVGVDETGLKLGGGKEIPVDSIVLATGYRAENSLYRELAPRLPAVHLIGDALNPENIKHAIWSAYEVARMV
ncbi:MAG: FAD-dependent oxidoreductase [Synergistota bacterium]|jgi:2-enoate reductase|nr:FAD-dependent oxidoreductase [Synergistota bacterium]OPZ40192.1 MAG: 2-enoate reductase FldZ [Synergistetes bacterium ADurb.BinA166]